MRLSDFDYRLPEDLIAQQPLADREGSRMLRLRRRELIEDRSFRDFPDLLQTGDLVVLNDSRVLPARLYGRRSGSRAQPLSPQNPASRDFLKGRVEVLLTKRLADDEWECLVHPGRKIGVGEQLFFGEHDELAAEVTDRGHFGERRIRFGPDPNFLQRLEQIGHVPLPPYIAREDQASDRERYQTVYAREPGSAAAPTAGLHFTRGILDRIRQRGIETASITLHVGLGTFQPIRTEHVETHRLHRESFEIPPDTAEKVNRALEEGRRIVAVGTTAVRTLEYAALQSGRINPGAGETDLFIYPQFQFRVVRAMLTNFHLPKSTLLMLVCAFAGTGRTLAAYRHAVEQRYRFYSYGDCMFVE